MGRIEELCALIDKCESFADVGCDHGYCARHVLESGKCGNVIITDISAKCLAKAESLLKGFILSGKCRAVCCDGLSGVPEDTEQVLIAGMGGEEIIRILTEGFIPRKFIFQPMKNAPKLRRFLLDGGCNITYDGVFKDGKFYFVIKGERGGGCKDYTSVQLAFGRDGIGGEVLKEYVEAELIKNRARLEKCVDVVQRAKISNEIALLTEVLK